MTRAVPHPADGALADGLREARRLLAQDPVAAVAKARAMLKAAPGHAEAQFILGAALRRSGDPEAARQVLVPLAEAQGRAWGVQFEAGAALAALGDGEGAVAALTRATTLNPQSSLAWHALGDQRAATGDQAGADAAQARALPGSLGDPSFIAAAQAFLDGPTAAAEALLRERFNLHLSDLMAVRMVADAGLRTGRNEAVERLASAALDRAPRFAPLRYALAVALHRLNKTPEALAEVERLMLQAPKNPSIRALKAAILIETGAYEEAVDLYASMLTARPDEAAIWISYGHALKTVGRQAEAVAAYRRALDLAPRSGEAYWSLANLKVVRFAAGDLETMQALLDSPDLSVADRAPLHFALGKGLEDEGRFEAAFAQYQQGARLRRAAAPYDADANTGFVRRSITTFSRAFFAEREGAGSPAPDPIFILGLPRSGSTLVEQMLSCHPQVEATAELPYLTDLAAGLAKPSGVGGAAPYPERLAAFDPAAFADLGAAFLARARGRRRLDRPYFIDKFPSNFMHVGLIHLILPKAKIIDVRRDAMDCCLSVFKQYFAQGQAYGDDLTDLGRYYADYVALMAHFDSVLPGRVHRVPYESLVAAPETELRRLLAYCGLPFDADCLRFHESQRPVRTASSEQVRRPLSRQGIGQWRRFEPWLEPLKAALAGKADPKLG